MPSTRRRDATRARRSRSPAAASAALSGEPDDEVTAVLATRPSPRIASRRRARGLIDGVERDLTTQRYASWAELAGYCRLVASTVGQDVRAHLRLRRRDRPPARRRPWPGHAADQHPPRRPRRSRAGPRLPARGRARRALALRARPRVGRAAPRWNEFVAFRGARARSLFASGLRVGRHIPPRAGICVRTMAGLYEGSSPSRAAARAAAPRRLSLSPSSKAASAAACGLPAAVRASSQRRTRGRD